MKNTRADEGHMISLPDNELDEHDHGWEMIIIK